MKPQATKAIYLYLKNQAPLAATSNELAEVAYGKESTMNPKMMHRCHATLSYMVRKGLLLHREIPYGERINDGKGIPRVEYFLNKEKDEKMAQKAQNPEYASAYKAVWDVVKDHNNKEPLTSVVVSDKTGIGINEVCKVLYNLHKQKKIKRNELQGKGPRFAYYVVGRTKKSAGKIAELASKVVVGEPQWSVVVKPKVVKKEVEVPKTPEVPMLFVFEIGRNTVTLTEEEARMVYAKLKGLFG